ncbi:hypothetical protein [Streptomyces sp. Wb2n-11]|nr:hypothetical protein [Streptomyces sp. Wb2n-11]
MPDAVAECVEGVVHGLPGDSHGDRVEHGAEVRRADSSVIAARVR